MKNIERPEVIEKMIKYFSTPGLNSYREDHLSKDIGFKGKIYSKDFEKWANSDYIEPFKITQAEKGLLELYYEAGMRLIRRFPDEEIGVSKGDLNYMSICIDKKHYAFLRKHDVFKIEDILNNCEVVE